LLVFGSVAQRAQQQMALAPTPLLPVPTLTSEPYPPPIRTRPPTITPQPYPPPQTPTVIPPATPTTEPPTPIVTPPVPITSTLEIIWAETTWIREENRPVSITFWRANVADLANRTEIGTLPIAEWLGNAKLSPDGDKIAFTTCSGSCGPWDGSLWVMNTDGSGLRKIAQGIEAVDARGHSPAWSRDAQNLIYLRVVPKEPLESKESADICELHSISADGAKDKTLVTEAMVSIYPLGWSADGKLIYYDRISRGHELWAVDANGERPPQHIMPLPDQYKFSPDGTKLIIYTPEEGLVILSTDGRERRTFVPPEQAFGGIWSSDGTEFIGRRGWELQLRAANVATGATRVLVTAQLTDISDDLLAISPDHQWLAIQGYGKGEIYLLWIGTDLRLEVPKMGIATFVGWIARRPY
ncbi:MAG: hypothetical protein H5T64_09695, partial [Chloroflexi bacterium]|nr:hypothetical protein [Chloroflexota bacterium]